MPIFEKTVSTAIEIAAPPMDVWAVLTDLSRYPEWNPHIREGAGAVAVGNKLSLRMYPPQGQPVTFHPRVIVATPGVELRLLGAVPGIFSGEHIFALRPTQSGTHLEQSEIYRGLLVPFIGKTIAVSQTSFQEHNAALKKRVESG
jgi:hypothetical protein